MGRVNGPLNGKISIWSRCNGGIVQSQGGRREVFLRRKSTMSRVKIKTIAEFGDFQTPPALAARCCGFFAGDGCRGRVDCRAYVRARGVSFCRGRSLAFRRRLIEGVEHQPEPSCQRDGRRTDTR